jgi:hypothetical protein
MYPWITRKLVEYPVGSAKHVVVTLVTVSSLLDVLIKKKQCRWQASRHDAFCGVPTDLTPPRTRSVLSCKVDSDKQTPKQNNSKWLSWLRWSSG